MKLSLPRYNPVRVAVVLLGDRLAVAAVSGERVETFSIATENPAAALREELAARQIAPRSVALGLSRAAAFVKPIDVPTVGGDLREMLRLNLEGHVPFAADDAAFDFVPLAADAGETAPRDELLRRVLVVAAEPRVVDAALRLAEEAQLRPASLTVAAHDLPALARFERGRRVVWVHRIGAGADVLCLVGGALQLSRAVPGGDEATIAEEIRRTLTVVRWKGCDAIWVSGDLSPEAAPLAALEAPVTEPDYTPRAQARLAALAPEERGAHTLALATASARGGRPLDLLPMPLRPRRLTKAQAFTLGVATVATLLLITALLVPSLREQRQLARINGEITRVDPDVRSVERVLRDLERKRKLLATINGIEANAMRPLPVLRELTELLPSDTWLTTLSLDQKGVELTGQAAAASALIPLLENSPVLERVEFSSPVTRGRDKEQFRIRAAWEAGGAQARATTPVSAPVAAPPVVGAPPAGPTPPPIPGAPPPMRGGAPIVPGGAGAPPNPGGMPIVPGVPRRPPPTGVPAPPAPIQAAPPRTGAQQ
jgi:Tfp pilus assembly protein PilN